MEKKMYKLSFKDNEGKTYKSVKKGEEFELPQIDRVGFYKKLLEIQTRIETKYKDLDHESQNYKYLISSESNIETTYMILNKIDNKVTRDDIDNMTSEELADFITALYRIEDFQTAEKDKKKITSPPKQN